MASEEKIYPGNLDRYRNLRKRREELEATPVPEGQDAGNAELLIVLASLAEELAGLAYIADGIRYSTRRAN